MRDYFGVTIWDQLLDETSIILKFFVATLPHLTFPDPLLLTYYHQIEKAHLQENEVNIHKMKELRDGGNADCVIWVNRVSIHVCFIITRANVYIFSKILDHNKCHSIRRGVTVGIYIYVLYTCEFSESCVSVTSRIERGD